MEYKDYYRILGVERDATQDDIKKAYRRLARKYHPDVSKEPQAEQHFTEANEAYEVLKDPEKRAAYDQLGQQWRSGEEFRPPPGWQQGFEFRSGFERSSGFSDFFESLFGNLGARPGTEWHSSTRTSRNRPAAASGEDHQAQIEISLEDAYHGATRNISLQSPQVTAEGHVKTRERSLNVQIPKGVMAGQRIRLAGQGAPSPWGGAGGDLYLEVAFKPHPLFSVDGRTVTLELPITPWEAALGCTVTVPTLGGKVDLRIPPNSQGGQKLRLKGRGLPGNPSGDQLVTLKLVTPRADSAAAKQFYQRMAEELPMNPRAVLGD